MGHRDDVLMDKSIDWNEAFGVYRYIVANNTQERVPLRK